jgi:hypothetical protein
MGWTILSGKTTRGDKAAVFVCTTTDQAFGPLMQDAKEAEAFANWLGGDPRRSTVEHVKGRKHRLDLERELLDFRAIGSPKVPAVPDMHRRHAAASNAQRRQKSVAQRRRRRAKR